MYSLIVLALVQSCKAQRRVIKQTILGANFSSNGQWPDKNLSGGKFPYLDGYWNISNIELEDVSTVA